MKTCIICNNEGKYKCPTCLIYYCSVTCCNKHRASNCQLVINKPAPESDNASQNRFKYNFMTEDTVSEEKLRMLENDVELKHILSNPHVRNLLEVIDKSENPEQIMQKAMLEPLFVEFADACLKIVEPSNKTD